MSNPVPQTSGGVTDRPPQPPNAVHISFLLDLICVCCGTVCAAYLVVVLVCVPIGMMYFGYTKLDQCPAEPMIPIYLILSGSFLGLRTIWSCLEYILFRHMRWVYRCVKSLMAIMTLLKVTLYLFGIYWVLRVAWPNIQNPHAFNYCDPIVYGLAFITIMGILLLMLFWCMCICILAFNQTIDGVGFPGVVPQQPVEIIVISN